MLQLIVNVDKKLGCKTFYEFKACRNPFYFFFLNAFLIFFDV